MRAYVSGIFIVAPALLFAAAPAADAATFAPAFLDVQIDGVRSERLPLSVDERGGFRGSFNLVACDGSVREATPADCAGEVAGTLQANLAGSVFPFTDFAFFVLDNGAPSDFQAVLTLPIPVIAGPVTTELSGEIKLPPNRENPGALETNLASNRFFEGWINGAIVDSLGEGPIMQPLVIETTFPFGPQDGLFDCASVGGCASISVAMGFKGLGGGQTTLMQGRFDVNPAAPVPLPAPAALLLAGLGALGALSAARRR